jgi:hypothetical protein
MPLNQTALHEAAHAVVARVLGVRVVRATVDPPCVRTKQGVSEDDLERLIIVDLAAMAVDSSAYACVPDEENASRRCREIVRLRHRLAMDAIMAPGIHAAILRRQRSYAFALVHKHQAAVQRVAEALAEVGTAGPIPCMRKCCRPQPPTLCRH